MKTMIEAALMAATWGIALWLAAVSAAAPACRLSEYFCDNGRCVPLNRYCNNIDDCGDSSDEPRHCTPCNRTYYGDVGKTYSLELHRPKEDRLPFICHLTFIAGGKNLGDIIQLTFDSFTIGRFVSFTTDGCPDGYLQIAESGRPQVGGSWCGTSWGPAIYYSETDTLTTSLRLIRLSKDQNGYNFDFRMEYKVLRRDAAIVRYGNLAESGFPTPSTTPSNVSIQKTSSPQISIQVWPTRLPPLTTTAATESTLPPVGNISATATEHPSSATEYYLGDLISGTYCSRIFSDCDKRPCRLQSPNFPGVYPRNLTCYYAVRQHEVPAGKHALISVRQPHGQLVAIRSEAALYSNQQQQHQMHRELKVWKDCDEVQDYVTVYDGYTTRDPVILKFCGGGEPVPEAVSSGHELLVEFTTSPYGTFLHPAPVQSLHGFQLEVEVKFVDIESPTYVKSKRICEFWIRGTNRGVLESPLHSLSPNTTCLYHLQGVDTSISPMSGRYPDGFSESSQYWRRAGLPYPPPRYRVWLSVLKFHVMSAIDPQLIEEEMCASHLNVWDGMMKLTANCNELFCNEKEKIYKNLPVVPRINSIGVPLMRVNASSTKTKEGTLLARYCKDRVPRSCDHTLLTNATRQPRPCAISESFLSSGDSLTLELRLTESTALRPVNFRALYEFVDLYQDGEAFGSGPCSRRFVSKTQENSQVTSSKFQAPKDVFLYGRGGNTNLSCVYRFEAQKGERVKLTLNRLLTGGRPCRTREDIDQGRLECYGNTTASVRFYELPWPDLSPPLARDCLCNDDSGVLPFTFISSANVVELHFDMLLMNSTDDFSTMFFEGSWEFIRKPPCSRDMHLKGPSGEIILQSPSRTPDEVNCENHPWIITPSSKKFLYVKINGKILKPLKLFQEINNTIVPVRQEDRNRCSSKNRIAFSTGTSKRTIVCPSLSRYNYVEVFSEGWNIGNDVQNNPIVTAKTSMDVLADDPPKSIVVEFLGRDSAEYSVMWLELSRRTAILPPADMIFGEKDCFHRCPELDACINASVWCDGISHCPSGYDEALTHCSFILQLPISYLLSGSLIIIMLTCLLCALIYKRCRRRRRSILQTRLKSLSSDTNIIDEKEVIC